MDASLDGRKLLKAEMRMNKKQRDTFLKHQSVLARIDSPGFWEVLRLLQTERNMTTQQVVTLMSNSFAAKFDDPEALFAILDRLQREIAPDGIGLVSGNDAFASRIHLPGFVDTVVACAAHIRALGLDPVAPLVRALHKDNARLMDKIGLFRDQLTAIGSARAAEDYLSGFRDVKATRKSLRARIDAW